MLYFLRRQKFLLGCLLLSFVIFLPSFTNFFFGDDWFHLSVIQINSVKEFFNFFSLTQNAQTAGSFRPLATQVYFFIFYHLFGLNPLSYHLFNFLVFAANLYLINKLAIIWLDKKTAPWAIFLYAISATNFVKMYFLSAFQETLMVFFILLSIIFFLREKNVRNQILSLAFFILSLLCKETAMVLPAILLGYQVIYRKWNFIKIFPYLIILGVYLYVRFKLFGKVQGESYIWDFSPKKIANTFFWYVNWSFGAPEFMVDYVSSSLRVVPKFFSDFYGWAYPLLVLMSATIITAVGLVLKQARKLNRNTLFFIFGFIVSIAPLLFLPWHKFTIELTLPMVFFCLLLAQLLRGDKSILKYLFIVAFITLNLTSNFLSFSHHYSVSRAKVAKRVFDYITYNYPEKPAGKYIEFINNPDFNIKNEPVGESKEISYAISNSDLFKVLYHDLSYSVYFQDIAGTRPKGERIKIISTAFLAP